MESPWLVPPLSITREEEDACISYEEEDTWLVPPLSITREREREGV